MGMPVKLSDELVLAARLEAEATERTITSQIEHWAKLGRAAEASLSYGEVVQLKLAKPVKAPAKESPKRDALRARMEAIAQSPERSSVLAALQAQGRPIYEAAPEHPGFVIRIEHNGKRVLGRFEGRQFVAQQPASTTRRRKIAGA
jgi:hypothetical protein